MQDILQPEDCSGRSSDGEENVETDGKEDQSGDEDDDPLDHFRTILEAIRLDEVPAFALSVRKRLSDSKSNIAKEAFRSPTVSSPPLTGSYHVLFPIVFDDGLRWLLKIPGTGVQKTWDKLAAESLSSEALTMQLLLRETTIPVPKVWEFSASLDNPLGVPFILMEYVEGLSLYDVWFDTTVSEDELEAKRTRTLEDVAKAMIQLSKFSFDRGGSIRFDAQGQPSGISPARGVDNHKMLARLDEDDENEDPIYTQYGPYDSPKLFFLGRLDSRPEPNADWQRQDLAMLKYFLNLVPESSGDTKPFVLTHPDFSFQNILVSQDGHLQAMIDWDGVAAVPRSIGNERYPSWLTRDWDPAMYAWKEETETDSVSQDLREDSPASLQFYRAKYARLVQSSKSQDDDSHVSAPDATFQSLVVENLLIAIEDSICTHDILRNLFTKVVAAGTGDDTAEAFDYWETADSLVEGDLSQTCAEALKTGFDAILAGISTEREMDQSPKHANLEDVDGEGGTKELDHRIAEVNL